MGQLFLPLFPLLAGIIFGSAVAYIVAWWILRSRIETATTKANEVQTQLAVSQSDVQNQLLQNGHLRAEIEALKDQIKQSDTEKTQLKVNLATVRSELEAERRQTPEKTAFLNGLGL
jgi:peptidoglycan hydrolase CwlO-like protein